MPDAAEVHLRQEPVTGRRPAPRPPSLVPWVVGVVLLMTAVAAFLYFRGARDAPATRTVASTDGPAVPAGRAAPLGGDAEPIALPPLDETDALVRQLVGPLWSHPMIAAWLATDGLIRNFVVVVENIAAGRTPSRHLRMFKPQGPFRVADTEGAPVIDPRSYSRYDGIAAAVASVDADGAARLYSTLKPRLEDAWAEIGIGPFDVAFETAIVRLLEVPAVEGEIALAPSGGIYKFDNPRLERLTQAQKQLARMGPRNVRTIQRSLRGVALALGIPESRLPGP